MRLNEFYLLFPYGHGFMAWVRFINFYFKLPPGKHHFWGFYPTLYFQLLVDFLSFKPSVHNCTQPQHAMNSFWWLVGWQVLIAAGIIWFMSIIILESCLALIIISWQLGACQQHLFQLGTNLPLRSKVDTSRHRLLLLRTQRNINKVVAYHDIFMKSKFCVTL